MLMDKIKRPRPENTLKEVGPIQSVTTYQNAFKNFQVPNQYVPFLICRSNLRIGILEISFLSDLKANTAKNLQ